MDDEQEKPPLPRVRVSLTEPPFEYRKIEEELEQDMIITAYDNNCTSLPAVTIHPVLLFLQIFMV